MTAGDRHRLFDRARGCGGMTVEQLWLRYLALGGANGVVELEAYLSGLMPLDTHQQDVLAHAINEHLHDLYAAARIPYLTPVPTAAPGEDPLTVLDELLAAPQHHPR